MGEKNISRKGVLLARKHGMGACHLQIACRWCCFLDGRVTKQVLATRRVRF